MSLQSFNGHPQKPRKIRRAGEAIGPRDPELLIYLSRGFGHKQIAEMMNLQRSSVERRALKLYERLGVRNGTHAVAYALRNKIIE